MSDRSKGRIVAALSVLAILVSLGGVGVSAGVYSERIDNVAKNQRQLKRDLGERVDRIDQRVEALYMHFLGDTGE